MADEIRLPHLGSDEGTWGKILNDFLTQSHNSDGTLKASAVATAGALTQSTADGRYVLASKVGQNNGVAPLDASGKVPSANLPATSGTGVTSVNGDIGPAVVLSAADIGLGNVDNTSDATKNSATATLTNKTIDGGSNTLTNIPQSSVTGLTSTLSGKYTLPAGGVPKTDLSSAVQTSLGKADSALQSAPVTSVNSKTGAVTLAASDVGALTQTTADSRYVQSSEVGQASGVASLDTNGTLPAGQLPAGVGTLSVAQDGSIAGVEPQINFISGSNVSIVTADDSANGKVDITINSTTGGGSSTLSGDTDVAITTPANGQILTYETSSSTWKNKAAPVTSVAGKTGAVTLAESDIANLTSDLAAKASTASLSAVATSGSYTDLSNKPTIPTLSDATTSAKGIVQLAGDLNGTGTSAGTPRVGGVQGVAVSGTAPTTGQVLTATSASAAAWATPSNAPVTSVNGKTGTVVLGEADIANLTTDLNAKAPKASPTFTGTVTVPAPTNNTDAATKAYVDSNAGMANPTTTKGDLIVRNGSAPTRLGVGTNGQVLTADSSQATGVKWATPSGGGGSGPGYNFVSKTANYTANNGDFVFITDASSGAVTITLPAPAANAFVSVKRLAASSGVGGQNGAQVVASSGYIDAASVGSDTINNQYQSQDYLSDGTNWFRI